ncbi:LCP family protein [Deinococcus ruber]|uniref:Membrane protein n=1 Tax=Deinococcus ruber TaxID=1848197 RepID=A0A918FED6_9DEIO|nr:LCP family protein [Deinococcus ruber]GGR28031.1 membrane protein [Deinococcus ruber]
MRLALLLSVLLAGVLALISPALPALTRYGAWPRTPAHPLNLLLAGVTPNYPPSAVWPYPASPEDYSGLTDTIVLAQLRADGSVGLLSIPRDTWTTLPGWGASKINASNRHGGPQMLVSAVQQLTGLHIDSYALLSLNALRDLTQAAGGVTLTVPEDMKYDDTAGHLHIDLKAGRQHLSGTQVEGFLRFRHDALGDIGRVTRQQLFLGALSAQLRSPLNVWRLPSVVAALDRNAKSDLNRQDFAGILGVALRGPKVSTVTLPGDFGPGGTWTPDRAGIRRLVQAQFIDQSDPHNVSIALVNMDAPQGSAARLKARLDAAGYQNVQVVSEDRHSYPQTTISGQATAARKLQSELGYGRLDAAAGAGDAALTVRLGADVK